MNPITPESPLNVHIINHTHWDREWFLTHVYTNAWIPGLIDRLEQLVAENPDFQYLLDGQTLIIEDLLNLAPHYQSKVEMLARQGNLIMGPYYCQPDWRMTCGEALLRNMLYGRRDSARFGAAKPAGWLVDTFGHISQAPQLHSLFGIESIYVWRGVPLLEPYFHWQSPEGSRVAAINLFGGYRNLYGVTLVPEIAVQRLETEARLLQPYYPTADVPLFDGYDLENDPEDPLLFFRQHAEVPPNLTLHPSTPEKFANIPLSLPNLPILKGELNSGKYGATFPGTLSARTYLKLMAHDCEHLLFQVCEPVAALASLVGRPYPAGQFEQWTRALLQNSIHDCLCGVSIDLVHEKMEFTYRQIFDGLLTELSNSLAHLMEDFAPGAYAVSTNPYPYEGRLTTKEGLIAVKTNGVGVWPVGETIPIEAGDEPISTFVWQNDHYTAVVQEDGSVQVGQARLGNLALSKEGGDAYSEEPGEQLEIGLPNEMIIEQRSMHHCVVKVSYAVSWEDIRVSATVRLTFDTSPLIRWTVYLESSGRDVRVEMIFESGHSGEIYAAMPFDIVRRSETDRDLLPPQLPPELAGVLLGQREIGQVDSFPFRDFVAISNGEKTSGLMAKGLRSYRAGENGRVTILLHRAVEWLTRSDLRHRVGDAGPIFYVPDARCERSVRHELAFASGNYYISDARFQQLNAGFQTPPLVIRSQGNGKKTSWQFFQESLPLNSLHCSEGKILARLHNPSWLAHPLSRGYAATDVWGVGQNSLNAVLPKKIVTLQLDSAPSVTTERQTSAIEMLNPPIWRVGNNRGTPDPAIIEQLRQKATNLETEVAQIEGRLQQATGRQRYHLEHQNYKLRREMYETLLSARLNELKLETNGNLTPEYLFQPNDKIMAIGLELNRMRMKRRIFDYVVRI